MPYKTILLNTDAYNRVSSAKRRLSEKLHQKLSFGDLFNEVFSKNIDLMEMDDAIRDYIKSFCGILEGKEYVLGILLFGSVAKGADYNRYSDIDLLVVVSSRKYAGKVMDEVHDAKKKLRDKERTLISRQLPTFISPIVLESEDLKKFRPIYLDFLDYGIALFERDNVLTDFLNDMRKIKHSREFKPYEVLRWQI